jgi:hypothetical protein
LLKKLRRRSHVDDDKRSVNERFTVASGEAPASWIPSQQDDRPPH